MQALWRWLCDAVTPPGADWYAFPVAGGTAALLGLGLFVLLRKRGRAARLLGWETRAAKSSSARRLSKVLRAAALALPMIAIVAAVVPGQPSVVMLPGTPSEGADAARRVPASFGRHRAIDARPAVESALAELAALEASSWYAPDAASLRHIRRAALDAARAHLEGRTTAAKAVPPLPIWVTESTEMTVVRALAVRGRAAWVGIDAAPQTKNVGWDAERSAYASAGLTLDLKADRADSGPTVRQLWGGRRTGGHLTFKALVSGDTTGDGSLHFVVGETAFDWPVPDDGKHWRVLEVSHSVAGPALRVVALPSGVATALRATDDPNGPELLVLTLPKSWGVNSELAAVFVAAWDELLGPGSDLTAELSVRRGLLVPRLVVRAAPAEDGPNLLLAEGFYRVQPAGVGPDEPPLPAAGPIPDVPTRIPAAGDRGPDSFTALDAPAGGAGVAAGARVAIEAVRTTSALKDGRFFLEAVPQTRPVVSTLAVKRRLATTIHLPPRRPLRPGDEDPSRQRATFAALVFAANDAGRAPAEVALRLPESSADAPRGRCLLTEHDVRALADEAGSPALLAAAAAAACYFLLLLSHTAVWVRSGGRPASSS